MSIRLVGELLTPISCPMAGVTIHLKALDTSASVLFSSEASVKTDYRGRYEFTVPTGLYLVSLDNGISQAELGQIQVYSDSTESTLQALLDAPKTEPSPIWLQQLEEKVAEATKQAGIATNAASEATTAAKTVKDNVDAAKQHADRAYASATNAAKSEASASADAVSAQESAVRAEEAAAISQSLGVVNPNLLINGDFSVCQRYGSSELAYTSGASYHADRWWGGMTNPSDGSSFRMKVASYSSGTCLEVQSVGSMSSLSIVQNVELIGFDKAIGGAEYLGSDVTVSMIVISPVPIACEAQSDMFKISPIKVVSPLVKSGRQQIPANKHTKLVFKYKTPDRLTESVPTSNLALNFRLVFTAPDGGNLPPCRFTLHKVKAEMGSVATPFVPDNPATNLMKCQRYFRKITEGIKWSYLTNFSASRNGYNLSVRGFTFPLMRSIPTVTLDISASKDAVTASSDKSLVRVLSGDGRGVSIGHPQNFNELQLKSDDGYIYLNSITMDAEI